MDKEEAEASGDEGRATADGRKQKSSEDDSKVKERTRITSSSLRSNSFSLLQKRKTRASEDGRRFKPLKWPQGVYDAILQLKKEDPMRVINGDFLDSVNKKCKSGIPLNGVKSWWNRHQLKQREGSSGTSASPGVKKEKKVKLERKASRPVSSDDGEDSTEDGEDSNKNTMKESHETELEDIPAILAAASDATVRLKSTSRTHTLTS
jgi:hypothetical protein